ncbi:MAG: hypothetical protein HXK63_06755 [Campylobacter sp.]|nr:hypothetical protein [Campylobacter sp.]
MKILCSKFMTWNLTSTCRNLAPLLCEIPLPRSAPLRRNFKLSTLNLSLNLGRESYKFRGLCEIHIKIRLMCGRVSFEIPKFLEFR